MDFSILQESWYRPSLALVLEQGSRMKILRALQRDTPPRTGIRSGRWDRAVEIKLAGMSLDFAAIHSLGGYLDSGIRVR
jgi:hypothetical protein